ncbi:MAG: pantetheine-phosphate adenylyltransferase [Gammaproteobacteria bacterium]|nr:MAG: pantetheine-phosphate adenylyltransferase [Gammaproteobacteria bacterium]
MNKNKIIYPGTFDPITYGHSNIISRAANLFDEVVVAVAESSKKQPFFSLEQRINLAQEVTKNIPQVSVIKFDCMLVDLAHQLNAKIILRGLRAVSDFEYEVQLSGMNHQIAPDIETIFISASQEHAFVSSSLVREMASIGGDVSQFIDPKVQIALKQELLKKKC